MPIGVDATHPATDDLINLSTQLLGATPAFFGRYFKAPHNTVPIQYQAAQENPVLSSRGVRVLCIGRQTNRVGGSASDGVADAVNNMSAIIGAFGVDYLIGLGIEPLVFLDTELSESQPTLSAEYYQGWAGALRNQVPVAPGLNLKFTPGVYINRSDAKAWRNLAAAINKGAPCHGAWVANYGRRTGAEGPPTWDQAQVAPKPPVAAPCPLLAWQYAGDYEDVLDFSILPPDQSANATVQLMIPPPTGAPVMAMAMAAALAPAGAPPSITVRHGVRYRATVVLSGGEVFASNDMIAGLFTNKGFINVTVTGSWSTRAAVGVWNGADATLLVSQIDPHLKDIQQA